MVRYDKDYLDGVCKDKSLELLKEYNDVNRNTIIVAKCTTDECDGRINKSFRTLVENGIYCCPKCSSLEIQNRRETTCFINNGVKNPKQKEIAYNKDFLNNICDLHNLRLIGMYGKVHRDTVISGKCITQDCDGIFSRSFRVLVEDNNFGCTKCTAIGARIKNMNTCLEIYNVDHPMKSKEFLQKRADKYMEDHGCEHYMQREDIKQERVEIHRKKHNCDNPMQRKEIKQKSRETCKKNHGVDCSLKSPEVREKGKKTLKDKLGFEHPMQCPKIKQKTKETNQERYNGHPMQNAEIAEKACKNGYKPKEYQFPSGRIDKVQGYEPFGLNHLINIEQVHEDDIITRRSKVPEIWYINLLNKSSRYYVDIYIPVQTRCIEIKSTFTMKKDGETVFIKQRAMKDAGYECEIWVYNSKGEIVEYYD